MHLEPMEFLEIPDGETWSFHISGFVYEPGIIHTNEMPKGKEADILRVTVPVSDKKHFPHYWDITSKRLIAQLLPILQAGGYQEKLFVITADGVKPNKWFTLEVK